MTMIVHQFAGKTVIKKLIQDGRNVIVSAGADENARPPALPTCDADIALLAQRLERDERLSTVAATEEAERRLRQHSKMYAGATDKSIQVDDDPLSHMSAAWEAFEQGDMKVCLMHLRAASMLIERQGGGQ